MSVTYDNSAKIATNSTSCVATLTIAANACLLVAVATKGTAGKSVSSVIANGTSLTQLNRIENDAGLVVSTVWGLTAAPSGVVSISCNMVGAAVSMVMVPASYIGASQTNPFSIIGAATAGAVSNIALSISSSTTSRVILYGAGVNTLTAMNATTRQVDSSSFGFCWADTAGAAGAISLSASALATSQNLAYMGINIVASVAAATSLHNSMSLLGVGV